MTSLISVSAANSQCTAGSVCLNPPGNQTVTQPSGTTLSVTTGNFSAQVGNQIYHAELFGTTGSDPCAQIKAATTAIVLADTATSAGAIIDARGFLSSQTDSNVCQLNPFASISQSTSNVPVQLLMGRQTITLSRQWVIPNKSGIIGMNGIGGYTSGLGPASNSALVACNTSGTHSPNPNCTSSFISQLTGCSFNPPSSSPGTGTITCSTNPDVDVGNFVLLEGTGTDLDNSWPVKAAAMNGFTIEYSGTLRSPTIVSNVVVNIPLVWLGSQAGVVTPGGGTTGKVDEGVYLEGLAIDCNDLPNSIGIFSTTLNEDSRLTRVMVRYCTRNGVYYQQHNASGVPGNFGTDRDLTIYMSDSTPATPSTLPTVTQITVSGSIVTATITPALTSSWTGYPIMFSNISGVYAVATQTNGSTTVLTFGTSASVSPCSSSCGTVSVVPAGYRASLAAAPFRGIEGATIRPQSMANDSMDGIQLDGVLGGTVQNIHCELLNNCIHITNSAPSNALVIQNVTTGSSSAKITGATYANELNGGTNIFVSSLTNYSGGTTHNIVSDPVGLPNAKTISATSLPLYVTGSGASVGKAVQSCGFIALSGSSTSLPCANVTADSLCTATPVGTTASSITGLALSSGAGSVTISSASGSGTVSVSCTI